MKGIATPLVPADAEGFLAEFLLQQRRYDEAAVRLAAALTLNPGNVRLRTVAALLDLAGGSPEKAGSPLLSLEDPSDWLIAYSAATGIAEMVERQAGMTQAEHLQAARRLFGVARRLRSEMPNALARLSALEVQSPEGPSKETLAAIERARLMAGGREDYAFIHAQVLARLNEFPGARNVIGPLMSPVHPPEIRDSARRLMGHIVELEAATRRRNLAAAQATGQQTSTPVSSAAEASGGAAPGRPGNFRPDFRVLNAGEHRLEGVLERIECGAAETAVFHVRTSEGPARASGRMADVEFVTFRDIFQGVSRVDR